MKRPDLSKLKPAKRAKAAKKPAKAAKPRPSIKAPAFVEDLYRDMRDRRLLVPALLLLVAIIAVPVALSKDKEPAPATVQAAPPEGAEAVAPAVLTEEPAGVRDYRERLDELKSKNPFARSADPAAGATETSTEPADIIVTPTDDGPTQTTSPAPSGTESSPTPATAPAEPAVEEELVLFVPIIDVVAGPAGKTREIDKVETGDLVPTKRQAPIAMFLGASTNLKYAHFAVSEKVTETRGDGHCRPRANDCEFLKLRDGEKRVFLYGPNEKRYSIKVTDIREEIVERRKAPSK